MIRIQPEMNQQQEGRMRYRRWTLSSQKSEKKVMYGGIQGSLPRSQCRSQFLLVILTINCLYHAITHNNRSTTGIPRKEQRAALTAACSDPEQRWLSKQCQTLLGMKRRVLSVHLFASSSRATFHGYARVCQVVYMFFPAGNAPFEESMENNYVAVHFLVQSQSSPCMF